MPPSRNCCRPVKAAHADGTEPCNRLLDKFT